MNFTGAQFVRALRKIARRRGVTVVVNTKRGKGDHAIVYFGDRVTVVGDMRKTLAPGTVRAMLAQLGLDETDFT